MDAVPRTPDTGFVRLLTVCTGNICRSPYAAAVLREGLGTVRPGAFVVSSAGTHALVGRPIDEGSARRLAVKGLSDDAFRATSITSRLLREQSVVLVMSTEHKGYVVAQAPAVEGRTFTIREFAAALDEIGARNDWRWMLEDAGADDVVSRWRVLPVLVAAHRRRVTRRQRDVADPYSRGERAFARMSREVDAAVGSIVTWEGQFPR